jgi:hypothetical protein
LAVCLHVIWRGGMAWKRGNGRWVGAVCLTGFLEANEDRSCALTRAHSRKTRGSGARKDRRRSNFTASRGVVPTDPPAYTRTTRIKVALARIRGFMHRVEEAERGQPGLDRRRVSTHFALVSRVCHHLIIMRCRARRRANAPIRSPAAV